MRSLVHDVDIGGVVRAAVTGFGSGGEGGGGDDGGGGFFGEFVGGRGAEKSHCDLHEGR